MRSDLFTQFLHLKYSTKNRIAVSSRHQIKWAETPSSVNERGQLSSYGTKSTSEVRNGDSGGVAFGGQNSDEWASRVRLDDESRSISKTGRNHGYRIYNATTQQKEDTSLKNAMQVMNESFQNNSGQVRGSVKIHPLKLKNISISILECIVRLFRPRTLDLFCLSTQI